MSSYFNPLPPHGGRRPPVNTIETQCVISIHSLRMEGDKSRNGKSSNHTYFNPLPPHGGRLWNLDTGQASIDHFNPLPPHGGRPEQDLRFLSSSCISIHSLRMEGDGRLIAVIVDMLYFNPLPPHGGRQMHSFRCS